jgi:hypothetical protein
MIVPGWEPMRQSAMLDRGTRALCLATGLLAASCAARCPDTSPCLADPHCVLMDPGGWRPDEVARAGCPAGGLSIRPCPRPVQAVPLAEVACGRRGGPLTVITQARTEDAGTCDDSASRGGRTPPLPERDRPVVAAGAILADASALRRERRTPRLHGGQLGRLLSAAHGPRSGVHPRSGGGEYTKEVRDDLGLRAPTRAARGGAVNGALSRAALVAACLVSACLARPQCPDHTACERDPRCLKRAAQWAPECLARTGCPSDRRRTIEPCRSPLPAIPVGQFLASPQSHPPPLALRGILIAAIRARQVARMYPMDAPPLALRASFAAPAVRLEERDGEVRCTGDSSALCCPLPLDGAPVVVTFAAGPRPVQTATDRSGDQVGLVMISACRLRP